MQDVTGSPENSQLYLDESITFDPSLEPENC